MRRCTYVDGYWIYNDIYIYIIHIYTVYTYIHYMIYVCVCRHMTGPNFRPLEGTTWSQRRPRRPGAAGSKSSLPWRRQTKWRFGWEATSKCRAGPRKTEDIWFISVHQLFKFLSNFCLSAITVRLETQRILGDPGLGTRLGSKSTCLTRRDASMLAIPVIHVIRRQSTNRHQPDQSVSMRQSEQWTKPYETSEDAQRWAEPCWALWK